MPVNNNHHNHHNSHARSHQSMPNDKAQRPMLRSRTQTFIDLSSRYSAIPASFAASYSPYNSPVCKLEESGRVTTAYAISVTAVNNRQDRWLDATEDANNILKNNTVSVRVVTIKKPYITEKPLPITPPPETPVNAIEPQVPISHQRNGGADGGLRVRSMMRRSRGSKVPPQDIVGQAGELDVLDMQGNRVPFRDIYLPSFNLTERGKQGRSMVVFIRPSLRCRVSFVFSIPSLIRWVSKRTAKLMRRNKSNSYVEHSSQPFYHL